MMRPCQLMNVMYRLQMILCPPCAEMYMLFPLHQNHFFFLPSKKGAQKKKARGFCVERSKAIQHTRARNEYISTKSHHHCRSKDDEGKRYNNAHTRERDVLRDDVGGGEKRERCREPSSFVVVVYVVVAK